MANPRAAKGLTIYMHVPDDACLQSVRVIHVNKQSWIFFHFQHTVKVILSTLPSPFLASIDDPMYTPPLNRFGGHWFYIY